jgi:hypothetical protein
MSESLKPAHWKMQFLSDVTTAAGLLEHGKQCKALAKRIGEDAFRMSESLHATPATEINAELLAAAKVLLETIKDDRHDTDDWPDLSRNALGRLKAAIARAEGGAA